MVSGLASVTAYTSSTIGQAAGLISSRTIDVGAWAGSPEGGDLSRLFGGVTSAAAVIQVGAFCGPDCLVWWRWKRRTRALGLHARVLRGGGAFPRDSGWVG